MLRLIDASLFLSLRGCSIECKDSLWRFWTIAISAERICQKTYYMSIGIRKSRPIVRRKSCSFDWVSVGRRIRELRGFQMTQKEFARRIGVSQGHFSYIERGEKEIGAEILLKIGREFGKSIEWLLTGED